MIVILEMKSLKRKCCVKEDRATDIFNNLEYIIIDDPVSSIDDTRIITLAIGIIKLIKSNYQSRVKHLYEETKR